MLGISVITLQQWDKEGTFIAHRNLKGRRYYTETQYREYMEVPKEKQVGKTVIYGLRKYKKKLKDDDEL